MPAMPSEIERNLRKLVRKWMGDPTTPADLTSVYNIDCGWQLREILNSNSAPVDRIPDLET